jgi:cob(I)alamin adenosyltransferase
MVSQIETSTLSSERQIPHTVEGLIQVFTCVHRSFFTNVMAQALRIAGQGTPVLVVQFLKGGINQGHEHPIHLGQNLDWLRCSLPRCIDTPHLDDAERACLYGLWAYTQEIVAQGKYTLVVLDELSLAIKFGFILESDVITFLKQRPRHVDVILTGPDMPQSILDLADQITELRRSQRT